MRTSNFHRPARPFSQRHAPDAAGCNIQDELFGSFEQVLALADKRGEPYTR